MKKTTKEAIVLIVIVIICLLADSLFYPEMINKKASVKTPAGLQKKTINFYSLAS